MEEMLFLGWQYGWFKTDEGKPQSYCNGFFATDFAGVENADYHFSGQKAVKKRCVTPEVWQGVKPNTRVYASFDSYGRVTRLEPITEA